MGAPRMVERRARRGPGLLAVLAALLPACGGGGGSPAAPAAPTPTPAPRPNIVLILTDDLDLQTVPFMPRLKALLADPGTSFSNAFVTTPLCAPSRASLLTGQYAHNHGLLANQAPLGGFARWAASGKEAATVATALKAAGYRTALIGKYINAYEPGDPPYTAPGWDDWHALYAPHDIDTYYDYFFNDNGTLTSYGSRPEDYVTDVIKAKALAALREAKAAEDARPFFLYLAPNAPHTPALRAPRYDGFLDGESAPRTPSFDEADVSDKPGWLQAFPLFTQRDERRIDFLYRDRIACMQSVEELLAALVQELDTEGELANTLIVLTSDNGFFLGPHRFNHGKGAPYEEAIRVPLVARGPGVAAGRTRGEFVTNLDLAPTLLALAGAAPLPEPEGRSLVPLLRGEPAGDWRRDFLVEFWQNRDENSPEDSGIPNWQGLRGPGQVYVEYDTGEGELYELERDPYQLENAYSAAPASTLGPVRQRLGALRTCRGAACR